jgi:branched-chain amino acid transport system substrate-binding protein
VALCSYLVENYGTRFFFVGSDYVYPRESNRVMRDLLQTQGGEVVGETYLDLRAKRADFVPVMRQIKNTGANVIFSTVVGDSTIYLYQSYAEAGLNPAVTPIASLTTTESEVRAMGFDVGAGQITAASYFQSVANERNTAFVARYQRRHGDDEPTNMCAEAAYFQVHIFANALSRTNSIDTDQIRPAVLGSDFDAPQGRVSVSAANGHTNLWTRIGRANRRGQFDIVQESPTPVWADPYLVGSGRVSLSV